MRTCSYTTLRANMWKMRSEPYSPKATAFKTTTSGQHWSNHIMLNVWAYFTLYQPIPAFQMLSLKEVSALYSACMATLTVRHSSLHQVHCQEASNRICSIGLHRKYWGSQIIPRHASLCSESLLVCPLFTLTYIKVRLMQLVHNVRWAQVGWAPQGQICKKGESKIPPQDSCSVWHKSKMATDV